jgi:uncharacterized coiled-coil DUF342 family protein
VEDIQKLFTELKGKRDALAKKSAPLRAKRDKILEEIQPKLDEIRKLEAKYREIEQPELAGLDNQIGALARALGAKTLNATENEKKAAKAGK